MRGKLIIDKSSQELSVLLYTLKLINDNNGSITRFEFETAISNFCDISLYTDEAAGRINRACYNKSKFARYFRLLDIDPEKPNTLIITTRGKELLKLVKEKTEERYSSRYYIPIENQTKASELILDSIFFDTTGCNNPGVEQSSTDIEPTKIILKIVHTLKAATLEEICFAIYALNHGKNGDSEDLKYDSLETITCLIKKNRENSKNKYKEFFEKYDIKNITSDFKLVPVLVDFHVLKATENSGTIYYSLNNIPKEYLNLINDLPSYNQPLQIKVYSHTPIHRWIEKKVTAGIGCKKDIIYLKETDSFDGEYCGDTFIPVKFCQALSRALKFYSRNIFFIIAGDENFVNENLNKISILFKRTKKIEDKYNGWSIECMENKIISDYLQREHIPNIDNSIRLPKNFNIIAKITTDPSDHNKNFDMCFKTCLVEVEENKDTDTKKDINENNRINTGENIIFYGTPGSGKSAMIKKHCAENNFNIIRVVFYPDYSNSDFVGQILPHINKDTSIQYAFSAGPFTQILKQSYENPELSYALIIEELNRGNAPSIFGETFQLLDRIREEEKDGYKKGTSEYEIYNEDIANYVYNDEKHGIRIPSNLSIICSMNTSDQNVFTLDTAFQRRWKMRLIPDNFTNVDKDFANTLIYDTSLTWKDFCERMNRIICSKNNNLSSLEDKRLGVYFVSKEEIILKENTEFNLFAEKVIKFLWDDVFKFNREEIFDTTKFQNLEEAIYFFSEKEKDERLDIFNEATRNILFNRDNE